MLSLLNKLLNKRGIEKEEDLSKEEKDIFDKYKLVLSGELVTIETLKEFCRSQIKIIESKCDGITPLTNLQQASLHVYFNLLKAIEAPESERESLERYLTQLIQ
jgi:hypothetical protein